MKSAIYVAITLAEMLSLLHASVVGCWSMTTNRSLVLHAILSSVLDHLRSNQPTKTDDKRAKMLYHFSYSELASRNVI